METTCLLDNGSRVNLVTPEYVKKKDLDVGSIQDLNHHAGRIPLGGMGGHVQEPLGYVILRVQIPYVPSYDEEQVALVVEDDSAFISKCPVVLGTPTINRAVRAMKESELEEAPEAWQQARYAYEYASYIAQLDTEELDTQMPTNTGENPRDIDKKLFLKKKTTIPAFESAILHCRTKKFQMLGCRLHAMTQAPYQEDEAHLPNGVYVLKTYTELLPGSQSVSVVLRNLTGKPVHLAAGRCVARVVAANIIPEAKPSADFMKKLEELEPSPESKKLTIPERQKLLMELLKKDGRLDKLKGWSPDLALEFERMLLEHHNIFSLDKNEIGCTDTAEHVIELLDTEPFKERFRRIAPPLVEEVREHIQEMLDGGAIRPSQSPWCNAVVLVRKKDGGLRFCIDFRRLNRRTKKDAFPLPRMQETMESMVGARLFSTMDLKSGFWQVKMAKESQQYTAFTVGSMGVYEFLRMPYGLCNAPATFQRLMQNCLGELNLTYALIYLDDVIVFSSTEEDHIHRLRVVFSRFMEHGLKLKPSKCHFLQDEITFLGHQISAEGMKPGTENLRAIAEMAPPTTYTGIREYTGMTGFFRRFIKGYAKIAKPLNDLLSGEASKLKSEPVQLTPEALQAFEELKLKCMTAPVLAFADFEKEFRLETDASNDGLGAVLLQQDDEKHWHPVAFASRELKGGEPKYHSSKLEFLALKWAVTEQFREYLQYKEFTVRTDNNPLTYVLTTPGLDALGHRWVAALAGFNMKLDYVKGTDNKVADALSRVRQKLDKETVTELLNCARVGNSPRAESDNINVIQEGERVDQEIIVRHTQIVKQHKKFRNLANGGWVAAQNRDPVIPLVKEWVDRPKDDTRKLEEFLGDRVPDYDKRFYAARQKEFMIHDGLLYLRTTTPTGQDSTPVFVVPAGKRQAAIDGCHRSAGHQGRDRTLSLMKERFWWPGMSRALFRAVFTCGRCKQYEAKGQLPPMNPILCTEPMELVHVDYVGMEVTVATKEKPVVKNVLVVVDHFTRYVQAYVTKNHTARTTARVLYNNYFSVFGFPQRLMSDQGTEFCGNVISAMCSLLGVEKIRTTPYHPQTNGSAERVHQTLQRMIGKLDPEKRKKWPYHIGSILIAYNSTRSMVTGFSPYFLMFGRRPRLPIDLLFPTHRAQGLTRTIDEYVANLYDRLRDSLKIAQDCAEKEAQRQKRLYDRKVGAVELRPGDRVLVRLDSFRGQRRKLKNRWGDDLHTVVSRVADGIPAYVVKNNRTGKKKVVHRVRLLLWLADYGEPVRCNLISISDRPPGAASDPNSLAEDDGGSSVPGCCLQYGTDLTVYRAVIEDPERLSDRLGREVRAGAPRKVAGQQIEILRGGGILPVLLGLLCGRRSV